MYNSHDTIIYIGLINHTESIERYSPVENHQNYTKILLLSPLHKPDYLGHFGPTLSLALIDRDSPSVGVSLTCAGETFGNST